MAHSGRVVNWNSDRGYGFIEPADGSDNIFVHISCVNGTGLKPRFQVYYDIGNNRRSGRIQAEDVSGPAVYDGSSYDGSSYDGSSYDGSSYDGSSYDGSSYDGDSHDGDSHDGDWSDGDWRDGDARSWKGEGKGKGQGKGAASGGFGSLERFGPGRPRARRPSPRGAGRSATPRRRSATPRAPDRYPSRGGAGRLPARIRATVDGSRAQAELRGRELQRREEQIAEERRRLQAEKEQVESARRRAQQQEHLLRTREAKLKEGHCPLPTHWTRGLRLGQGWRAVAEHPGSSIFAALAKGLRPGPQYFGSGSGGHSQLVLECAWRIEHPVRWQQYALERCAVQEHLRSKRLPVKELRLRQALADSLGPRKTPLPEPLQHSGGLNEVRLLHATAPEHLLAILSDGFNPRLAGCTAGTKFGAGTYLAEDAGKCDRYAGNAGHTAGDSAHADLERRLYRDGVTHPGKVFYTIVCRVTAGCYASTKDGKTQTSGEQLWASDIKDWSGADPRRELCYTPGGSPGCRARYTSLLAEPRCGYKEFVVFDTQRLYPEYVLAYSRK